MSNPKKLMQEIGTLSAKIYMKPIVDNEHEHLLPRKRTPLFGPNLLNFIFFSNSFSSNDGVHLVVYM